VPPLSDEKELPRNIELKTRELWHQLRNQTASEGRKYNINTFINKWTEDMYRTRNLIAALEQESVNKELRDRGYVLTPIVDESNLVIRKELKIP
jgi:hypothetical protein